MFDTLTNPRQRAFLAAFIERGRIKAAAKAADIARETHYDWLNHDAAYAEAFARAVKLAGDTFEDEAIRRAVQGTVEPYVHKGEIVREVIIDAAGNKQYGNPILKRKYSDRLLALVLSAAKPDKYSKKVEHAGEVTLNLAERLAAGRARVARRDETPDSPGSADS